MDYPVTVVYDDGHNYPLERVCNDAAELARICKRYANEPTADVITALEEMGEWSDGSDRLYLK